MSIVAEFARILHEKHPPRPPAKLTPSPFTQKVEQISDVQAVIFDVYGTLIQYWNKGFTIAEQKERTLLHNFARTIAFFKLEEVLLRMSQDNPAEKTLYDLYHGLIALEHEKGRGQGVQFPEIRIEQIWLLLLAMFIRNGYDYKQLQLGEKSDVAACMGYYYNFFTLSRGLYPQVVNTLRTLKKNNMRLGIVSNGQFYTRLDLTLFLRDQSNFEIIDLEDLFDENLVYFSYEYGEAKPGRKMFQTLYDALYEYHILPQQTVYVGNDLASDIQTAEQIGMKTALFCGDSNSLFTHGLENEITPDTNFTQFDQLAQKLSFWERKT